MSGWIGTMPLQVCTYKNSCKMQLYNNKINSKCKTIKFLDRAEL
jgi:hypothetical protein